MILEDTLLTKSEYIRHAVNIAEKHRMGKYGVRNVPNAAKCGDIIAGTYTRIVSGSESTPGAINSIPSDEWIGDNFHLISEAVEAADSEESKKLVRALGKAGAVLGIYDIAAEITAHTDGCVGETEIIDFVSNYEKGKPLSTDELACLCHMLRVALLKRLSEICERSDHIYRDRKEAERIFREFAGYTGDMENGRGHSADVLFENEDMLSPVVAETMLRRSAESENSLGSGSNVIRAALSKKLAAKGTTVEELIAREHTLRISLGISAGNAIRSLHGLNSLDWDRITSVLCVAEQILNRDPSGVFLKMTSKSRAEYVRLVRVCAKRRAETPEDFALQVVAKAEQDSAHIGKYIYEEYTKKQEFKPFLFMLYFITLLLSFCPLVYTVRLAALQYGWAGIPLILVTSVLLFLVSIDLSLSLTQKMYMEERMPFSLPELDFRGELPEDCRVMIVIPCLLNSKKRIDEIIRQLEAAAWANPQKGMYFTMLGDLAESSSKTQPADEELIRYAQQCIRRLETAFGKAEEGGAFHVWIRERVFYKEDNLWMGAERKRGALTELNRAIIDGRLPRVNYVLTVDADTVIPIHAAVKMAQIMHHPLNRPQISYVRQEPVVTKGYALLQPAVTPAGLDRDRATSFERLYCDEEGYDSYQCKTSDFYFDICNAGIYTGKGMYDPYVFNALLEGRFRENSILSHDLLEGSFLRTGFVSDVHLYDHFPRSYGSAVKREHRWIRGDWQLLPFRRKRFADAAGVLKNNPLDACSLFKMDMNLLRSLLPCALFLLLTIGMLFLRRYAVLWVLITVLTLFLTAGGALRRRPLRVLFDFLFLPHRAYYHCDAAVRAVWRTYVSRKHMLEWVVSSDAEKSIRDTPAYYCKMMWFSFAAAVLFAPFLWGIPSLLWIAAPYAAYFLSAAPRRHRAEAQVGDRRRFRILARKIWAFYDDYAVENENYLPPDNVQFSPVYCIAHRTSPTNIGFLLISVLIAERFGYLSCGEMTKRLTEILATIDKMEKWHGHIYNWYDTITLQPLEPRYVSSVDSGNLAACLLTAASLLRSRAESYQAADEITRATEGLLDTIYCLNEIAQPDHRIETGLLEEYLAKEAQRPEELMNIIRYYTENIHVISGEKADAHSFRCKFIAMAKRLRERLEDGAGECGFVNRALELSAALAHAALQMDFKVLYGERCRHLYIGYNQTTGEYSSSYYDMLLSEARLTSYVAMGKGDLGAEHFTALARRWNDTNTILLSWSGTVFEYLLPELFLRSPAGSALRGSVRNMLRTEIAQAEAGRPWGISESGYNVLDLNMSYKYKAFGLKQLAVKRMREDDTVIAPYASVMACAHVPAQVLSNLDVLERAGAAGKYGFYEAIDDTPGRKGIVESFMAHHLGMSLCGIANLLFDGMLTDAFGNMPMMAAVNVMLTGKMPRRTRPPRRRSKDRKHAGNIKLPNKIPEKEEDLTVCLSGRDAEVLSNGKYSVVINGLGGGYSTFGEIGVSVRRENKAPQGVIFYLDGELLTPAKCELHSGKAEYTYFPEQMDVLQSICVAPDEHAEIRSVRITNKGREARSVNLTLYCELMLARPRAYADHPSYSGMFLTTEAQLVRESRMVCLTARRRRHREAEPRLAAYCVLHVPEPYRNAVESEMYDTDALRFKGRNTTPEAPAVFRGAGAHSDVLLAGHTGTVLYPCFAINVKLRVEAGASAELDYIIGIEESEDNLSEKLERLQNTKRTFELARTRSFIEREHISLRPGDLQYFRSFSAKLLYGRKFYSAELQRRLWSFGVSGDNPIITVMLRHIENAAHLERLVRMWCFYSFRGIQIDLVLAVFDNADYISPIHELADTLALKALWGCFTVRGDIYVVVPKDGENAKPLIEASNIVFWL